VLLVLVTEGFKAGKDPVSRLVALARWRGDLEAKPGKLLQAYRAKASRPARAAGRRRRRLAGRTSSPRCRPRPACCAAAARSW
jgi:leucyl aminopeptidase